MGAILAIVIFVIITILLIAGIFLYYQSSATKPSSGTTTSASSVSAKETPSTLSYFINQLTPSRLTPEQTQVPTPLAPTTGVNPTPAAGAGVNPTPAASASGTPVVEPPKPIDVNKYISDLSQAYDQAELWNNNLIIARGKVSDKYMTYTTKLNQSNSSRNRIDSAAISEFIKTTETMVQDNKNLLLAYNKGKMATDITTMAPTDIPGTTLLYNKYMKSLTNIKTTANMKYEDSYSLLTSFDQMRMIYTNSNPSECEYLPSNNAQAYCEAAGGACKADLTGVSTTDGRGTSYTCKPNAAIKVDSINDEYLRMRRGVIQADGNIYENGVNVGPYYGGTYNGYFSPCINKEDCPDYKRISVVSWVPSNAAQF